MKKLLILFLLSLMTITGFSQIKDTLKKAIANINNYYWYGTQLFGTMSNGHIYQAGFVGHYDGLGHALPMEAVRTDITTGEVIYKTIDGTLSSNSALWVWSMDSLGNVYTGLNSNNRRIFKFNFKDGITYENLWMGFAVPDTTAAQPLAYSISLGLDGHIYFGASSGGTYWSEYNPSNDSLYKHPEVDPQKQYVLGIYGDTNYVYTQIGQTNTTDYWAIKKSDNSKVKLWSISTASRFSTKVCKEGAIYVMFTLNGKSLTYKLKGFDTTRVSTYNGKPVIDYYEVNNPNAVGGLRANAYFDKIYSILYFNNNQQGYIWDSAAIASNTTKSTYQTLFFDNNDTTNVYYIGYYYGDTYIYNYSTDSSWVIGSTGYNAYSTVQYNDSIFYWGCYPSGALIEWNKNKSWTANKFINGKVIPLSDTSNPRLCGYFRSNTSAQFHHPYYMHIDANGYIVATGDVIRTINTCSIGAYNPATRQMWGYNADNMPIGINVDDMIVYGNLEILSTNNVYGGHPKLYFYDAAQNIMADSIDLGFTAYGKLQLRGDTLIGTIRDRVYKIYLPTKQLVATYMWSYGQPFALSIQLEDGWIGLNTSNPMPQSYFIKYPYPMGWAINRYIYYLVGTNIVRVSGFYPQQLSPLKSIPSIIKPKMDKIYPNPASSFIYMKGGSYSFYNEAGKEVLNIILYKDGRVDISELHPGMYFLIDNKTRASQKLMIIR